MAKNYCSECGRKTKGRGNSLCPNCEIARYNELVKQKNENDSRKNKN